MLTSTTFFTVRTLRTASSMLALMVSSFGRRRPTAFCTSTSGALMGWAIIESKLKIKRKIVIK